jgi:hypothetical protein
MRYGSACGIESPLLDRLTTDAAPKRRFGTLAVWQEHARNVSGKASAGRCFLPEEKRDPARIEGVLNS